MPKHGENMPLPVRLQDVVDEMDAPADGWKSYINRRTGEIFSFSENDVGFYEDEEKDCLVPDWQAELTAKAREVEASDDFVQLPDKFDINEYAIMERFCHTLDDDTLREDLLDTIGGRGTFRRFKGMLQRRGLADAWWSYRDAAFKRIAADFLEAEGIPFEDT